MRMAVQTTSMISWTVLLPAGSCRNGAVWYWATRMTTTACNESKSGNAFSGIVHTYQRWSMELMTVYECIVLGCYEGKISSIHKDVCVLDEVLIVPCSLPLC